MFFYLFLEIYLFDIDFFSDTYTVDGFFCALCFSASHGPLAGRASCRSFANGLLDRLLARWHFTWILYNPKMVEEWITKITIFLKRNPRKLT